jgi:magnesium-transporting ATPase (P-type)
LRASADGRAEERSAQAAEAIRLKAQRLPPHIQKLWAKAGNHVQSNKYTLLSFFPLALRLQFREVANVYFLFIAVFYAWERVSPVAGLSRYSGAVSLAVVLVYALVLEAVQDLRRWRQDQSINNAPCLILNSTGTEFEGGRWRDVCVGDFVKVAADQAFPADLLLLISEHKDGLVYVETASLDGETNLKVFEAKASIVDQGIEDVLDAHGRQTVSALLGAEDVGGEFEAAEEQTVASRIRALEAAGAQLECELPTASLYEWSGSVSFAHRAGNSREVPVDAKQLCLLHSIRCVYKYSVVFSLEILNPHWDSPLFSRWAHLLYGITVDAKVS